MCENSNLKKKLLIFSPSLDLSHRKMATKRANEQSEEDTTISPCLCKKAQLDYFGKGYDITRIKMIIPGTFDISDDRLMPYWDDALMSILFFAGASEYCERLGSEEANDTMMRVLFAGCLGYPNFYDMLSGNMMVFVDFDTYGGDFCNNSEFVISVRKNAKRELKARRWLSRLTNYRGSVRW